PDCRLSLRERKVLSRSERRPFQQPPSVALSRRRSRHGREKPARPKSRLYSPLSSGHTMGLAARSAVITWPFVRRRKERPHEQARTGARRAAAETGAPSFVRADLAGPRRLVLGRRPAGGGRLVPRPAAALARRRGVGALGGRRRDRGAGERAGLRA